MIQVLFYGDRLDDGTREWLETFEYTNDTHFVFCKISAIITIWR